MFVFRLSVLETKALISGYSFVLLFVLVTTLVDENVAVVYNIVEMLDLLIVIILLVE